ncbi:uncharacterized protein LOC111707000 isoform X2 [Eurytemora carolleeae]|uniref:uncharacterized protein LOC111707000 isoform X2 n=1 Tax=Eurytemora carolleeae TaxID=1294199 RepID=UPI000C783988|nr:uncharacterized protein LOC111707000 isoform X2 [Eurytemora carolleeae]|eukprot:XP_023335739.1 uncharacterized protein LOC111707000 isoform X2 [Eurytemora affinis]
MEYKSVKLLLLQLLLLAKVVHPDSYWSEDYDKAKNCENESLIAKLLHDEETKSQCHEEVGELNDIQEFQNCKLMLAKSLGTKCASSTVKKAGDLLYCKSSLRTVCCYHNHTCVQDWMEVLDNFGLKAQDFLKDKNLWLNEEKKKGYSSCHALNSSLDASICQEDCKNLEKSDFGKQCKKDGGFFKCCVRRDKANCHECRFCCTLLLCTTKIGKITYTTFSTSDGKSVEVNSTAGGIQQAKELFYLTNTAYKNPDYRCLNPNSNKDPTILGTYSPTSFASALSQEKLKLFHLSQTN